MIKQQALDNAINLMELEFYRVKRYGISICIAVVESECKDLFNNVIENTIRTSDLYQYLDANSFVILFDHTDAKGAKKALDKIVSSMENICDKDVFMGYTQVLKTDEESSITLQRALKALKSAKQSKNDNIVRL